MSYDVDPYLNSIKNNTSRLTDEQKAEVRYWINLGCDIVAYYWEKRDVYKEKYSNNRIYNYDYEYRLEHGFYDDGVAIITGKLKRGPHKGKWLTVLDFDSLEAFLKFAGEDLDYKKLGAITRIEYAGNLARVHVFILSDKPFVNKSQNGLEVKAGNPKKLLAFVSPSINKRMKKPYTVFDTKEIEQITTAYDKVVERIAHVIPGYPNGGSKSKKKYSNDVAQKILELILPYYVQDHRDHVLFGLSGLLRKSKVSLESCLELFALFPDNNDSERNRGIAEQTYNKEIDDVAGYSYLKDTAMIPEEVIKEICDMLPQQQKPNDEEDTVNIVEDISEQIMTKYDFATIIETKDVWYFKDGVYVPYGEELIEREAEALYGYDLKIKVLNEVKGHITRRTQHSREEFDSNLDIINCRNGLYNWRTDTIQDHTPDYLSVIQVNIVHDPSVISKEYDKYLKEVLYPMEIQTATEMIAYTFYRSNPFDILNFLHGSGGNGKGVFTGLITAAHGSKNVCNVSLRDIENDPFALADFENKAANIDPEVSVSKPIDPTTLKRLTDKQPTRINRKNRDSYDVILYAKLFLSPNKIPESTDQTDAYYRRNVILTFPRKFEGKDIDFEKLDKLTTESELSGMFNIWMKALRNLMKNKGIFVNENTIEERRQKYSRSLNPVKSFMDERVLRYSKENDIAEKGEFYHIYREYCQEFRLSPRTINDLSSILTEHPYYLKSGRQSKGDKKRYWKAVGIFSKEYRDKFDKELEESTLDQTLLSGGSGGGE